MTPAIISTRKKSRKQSPA